MDTISQEDGRRAFDDLAGRKRIIVIAGAGLGTSRGIPDFRSKTGLFGKSGGKDSFDITQVYRTKESTDHFYKLVQTIHQAPSEDIPSTYRLFKALQDKGCLLRIYQQNIDGLDARILDSDVDIPVEPPWKTVIRMHGDVSIAKCDTCHTKYPAFDPMRYSSAKDIPCDACSQQRNARASSNRRPMRECAYQVGKLLPWVVMYNEYNPDLQAISNCSINDLNAKPDAIIVIGTTLRIRATHTLARVLCLEVRGRKLPTFWISNEVPAKKDQSLFQHQLIMPCDTVGKLWLSWLNDHATNADPVSTESPAPGDNISFLGNDDGIQHEISVGTGAIGMFDYYIKSISTLLNSLEPFTQETDEFEAPYIHPRPLVYKDREEKQRLKKLMDLSASACDRADTFNSFFKCRPNGVVRVALFTTCESNAIERKQRKLSWSLWAAALVQRQAGGEFVLLVFDPNKQLLNPDGSLQSLTRQLSGPRENFVQQLKKDSRRVSAPEIWHSATAEQNSLQEVRNFVNRMFLAGNTVLAGDEDIRLQGFRKLGARLA